LTKKRFNKFIGFVLVFGPALLLIFIGTRSCEHKFEELADYGPVAEFEFTDANGNLRNSKEFKDEIILINVLQSTCPDSCSVLMWHLNQTIYQHVWKNKTKKTKKIRMISFLTDGEGNPVKDLSVINDAVNDLTENYDPSIWILATGNVQEIYNLESNGVSLTDEQANFQELMLLVDKQHHLRMVLSGKVEGQIRRMKQSMALLQKQYDKQVSK
jgi:cytochrome oxidase Cu insertion factor (SCO1/SenC/PrrC family)|tara:strand:+ start:440 stop:1081 length:642 start_codon:yes stop_codon:yes gene_type:complete